MSGRSIASVRRQRGWGASSLLGSLKAGWIVRYETWRLRRGSQRAFFCGWEKSVVKACLGQPQQFAFTESHAARVFVFIEQRRMKHGGIVRRQNHWYPVAE